MLVDAGYQRTKHSVLATFAVFMKLSVRQHKTNNTTSPACNIYRLKKVDMKSPYGRAQIQAIA